MRNKLIQLLDEAVMEKEFYTSDGKPVVSYPTKVVQEGCAEALADYLIAHGVTIATDNNIGGKWIPVSERLPEDSGLTLVRVDFSMWDKKVNVPSLERYVNEEKAWFCDGAKLTNVTHWMPLPAAPKEVE